MGGRLCQWPFGIPSTSPASNPWHLQVCLLHALCSCRVQARMWRNNASWEQHPILKGRADTPALLPFGLLHLTLAPGFLSGMKLQWLMVVTCLTMHLFWPPLLSVSLPYLPTNISWDHLSNQLSFNKTYFGGALEKTRSFWNSLIAGLRMANSVWLIWKHLHCILILGKWFWWIHRPGLSAVLSRTLKVLFCGLLSF